MGKKIIKTDKAPAPIGPYNQAVMAGDLLFCSGQIPLDAGSGQLVTGEVEEQARKVMENLGLVLDEAGMSFGNVVKTTIFLKSMDDFPRVNEVYGSFFKENPPARSTVEVSRLPKDVRVEIDLIASR